MDMTLEFWLDFDSKDRDVLLKVANQAIVKVEREVRGFLIKSQQMLRPQDATVVVSGFGQVQLRQDAAHVLFDAETNS